MGVFEYEQQCMTAVWFETHTRHTRESRSQPGRPTEPPSLELLGHRPSLPALPPLAQRRAPRSDQLRVRGDALLRHPRPAVDAVPGRQLGHRVAARVLEQVDRRSGSAQPVAPADLRVGEGESAVWHQLRRIR